MNAALRKSYDLERQGLEFYIGSAVKSPNALARRTLFSLAGEEIKHMMKIDEIALSLGKDGKWPEAETARPASGIESSIRQFFENARKEALGEGRDNVESIKKAMELERKSYELYSDFAREAKSAGERRFYEDLKAQEQEHYAALENVCYYLTDTGGWFGKDEARVWNWMNL